MDLEEKPIGYRLNSRARSLFLQHYENQFPKTEAPVATLFKVWLISRRFLRSCLRYKDYMFMIEVGADSKFNVYIQDDVKERMYRTVAFEVTLDQLVEMNSVLHVQQFGLKFHWQNQETEVLQFDELCDKVEGQISLEFFLFTKPKVLEFGRKIRERLIQFRCHAKLLTDRKYFPRLQLQYCRASKVEGFGQTKQILASHQIKELYLQFSGIHQKGKFLEVVSLLIDLVPEDIKPDFFDDFPVCSTLHQLTLNYQMHKEDKFMDMVQQMMVFFPRLRSFELQLSMVGREPKAPEIAKFFTQIWERVCRLRNACLPTCPLKASVNYECQLTGEEKRGISFDDCAYEVNATETITCIKWSLVNQTEWYAFWNYYKIDPNTVTLPSAWYANAYYICLLLLVWYVLDMSSMLVMCCKQRKNVENFEYHKQVSILSAIFIIITYISVHIGLAHGRQTKFIDFRMKANQTLGIGAKIFIGSFCFYVLACAIQHVPDVYNCQRFLRRPKWTRRCERFCKCCRPNTEIEEQAPGPSRSPKPGPSRSPIAGPSTRQKVEIEMRPLKEM